MDIVDLDGLTLDGTILDDMGFHDLAASPDGLFVYVTGETVGLAVVETESRSVVDTLPLGGRPGPIAVSPDGERLFVADIFSGEIVAIDRASLTVVDSITVTDAISDLEVSANGELLYGCSDNFLGALRFFELSTDPLVLTRSTPLNLGARALALAPAGDRAYVAGVGEVSVVDLATFVPTPFSTDPGLGLYDGVTLNDSGSTLYVSSPTPEPSIQVVDTTTLMVTETIPVPQPSGAPGYTALSRDETTLYVTLTSADALGAVDLGTSTVTSTVAVDDLARRIVIPPPPVLPPPPIPEIPTLESFGLSLLALSLLLAASLVLRRHRSF